MRLFHGTFLDTPDDPFGGGRLRAGAGIGVLVDDDGVVVARDSYSAVRQQAPDADVVDLRDGVTLPGFVDTHVHFPQVRVIGALGMPLLEWLDTSALPEEARMADDAYAAGVARDFVDGLVGAGTTTALVFGAHFASAVDLLFAEAARAGLRVTSGLVVSDRMLRDDLHVTPEQAYRASVELAARWHRTERLRYAVTPRFSLSCSDHLLDACAAALDAVPGALFTSHVNENLLEIAEVRRLSGVQHYVESYDQHGLLGPSSVLAHNVHPTRAELDVLAARQSAVAHCPTSNSALGSGMFPMREHVGRGVPVALGSDVGAGTGFSLLKEGLQALFIQQQMGDDGLRLTPTHLLHLATRAGAHAMGLGDVVGDLSVGRRFDAQWIRPVDGTPLAAGLRHADDAEDALARIFALGTPADVRSVWVDGEPLGQRAAAPDERATLP